MASGLLYPDLKNYAHPMIQTAIRMVGELESKWNEIFRDFKNIHHLIRITMNVLQGDDDEPMNTKRAKEVFQFFCASVIYAEAISRCKKGTSLSKFRISYEELEERITLPHLDKIAKDILDKMVDYTFLDDTSSIDDMNNKFAGTLASLKSGGSIPFMKVYTYKNIDVSMRQGFELIENSKNTRAKQIQDINEQLKEYPIKTYQNGEHQRIMSESGTLKDIIDDDDFRRKVLKGKYITWIHKTLNEFDYDKISYEIEFLIQDVKSNARKSFIDTPDLLESLAGRSKVKWNDFERGKFSQEDIIVTFFNDVLFDNASVDCDMQELETWAQDIIIKEVVSPHSDGTLYIGLCYKTIIDGGFCDKSVTSGSTNILLLALARGFAALYGNTSPKNEKKTRSTNDDIAKLSSHWLLKPVWLSRTFIPYKKRILWVFWDPIQEPREISEEEEMYRMKESGIKKIEGKKDKILSKEIFLGANSQGIIVNITYPRRLILITILFLSLFIFFAVVMARGRRATSSLYRFVDYCGTLAEVSSSMIAVLLILVKIMFRRWEFGDMLHSRRRAQSFTELSRILPKKRSQAIRLLASLENPEKIFSHHRSCAFVHEGQGEFEIDSDIDVRELQDAGFKFGVNYYGEKVVADLKGNIRRVVYTDKTEDVIHIEEPHLLQTRYIYLIPTKNVLVGSRIIEDPYRIADEV